MLDRGKAVVCSPGGGWAHGRAAAGESVFTTDYVHRCDGAPVPFSSNVLWPSQLGSASQCSRGVSSTLPSTNRPQRAVLSGEIWRERKTKGHQQLRAAKSPGMALGGLSLHPAVQHQPGQGDPCSTPPCSSYFGSSEPQRACSWVHGAPFILLCSVINTAGGLLSWTESERNLFPCKRG